MTIYHQKEKWFISPIKIHDPEFKYLKSFGIRIKDKWYKELWWSIIEFIRSRK